MGNEVGSLVVQMAADMARFESDMKQANRISQDTMRKIQSDAGEIRASFDKVGQALGVSLGVGSVMAFTKSVTEAALAAQKLDMQFKAVTGNAAGAARELAYVKNLSSTLGLDLQTTASAYGKFMASTRDTSIEGRAAQKVFEGVSAASTALGLSADETSGIFLALSQMMSKGKVQAEELRGQLGERLPGAFKLAATAMGMTTAELDKQMADGKVMSADLLPKLASELQKTYGKAAKEAADQGRAGLNLFKNEVFETSAAIGSHLLPAVNRFFRTVADEMKEMRNGSWFGMDRAANNLGFLLLSSKEWAGMNRKDTGSADLRMYDSELSRQAAQDAINAARAQKEADAAAAAEAEKRAESERVAYNQGVQAYNRMVDAMRASDPTLSETERKVKALREEVAALGREHPEQAADAKAIGAKIEANLRLADSIKVQNAEMKEQIRLMEEINKDMAGFGGMVSGRFQNSKSFQMSGLSQEFGLRSQGEKPSASLLGSDYSGRPLPGGRFSLTGPAESSFFGGKSGILDESQKEADERLMIEEKLNQDLLASKTNFANQSLDLLRMTSKEGGAIAIGAAVLQKALAVAQIIMSTNAAAAAAVSAPPIGLGPVAGVALAGEIKAMGYANAAITGAIGIAQIAGSREKGGPVSAGRTYLVGEKGPELFTPGATGAITPNGALGGGSFTQHVTIDARGADAGVEHRIRTAMKAAKEQAKAEILNSMNRGGEFALASGRLRG